MSLGIMEEEDLAEYFRLQYGAAAAADAPMCQRRMEALNLRWEELSVKKAQLKAHIQFIQENDQKWIRAMKKANKERELKRQHMQELTKGKQEMVALRLEHQRLSAKLQGYSIFNKYLKKVVENSEVSPRSLGGRPWHLPQPHLLFPGPWGGVQAQLAGDCGSSGPHGLCRMGTLL
ncbi:hypothetical protein H8959_015285 [Pygathrix nigripes]